MSLSPRCLPSLLATSVLPPAPPPFPRGPFPRSRSDAAVALAVKLSAVMMMDGYPRAVVVAGWLGYGQTRTPSCRLLPVAAHEAAVFLAAGAVPCTYIRSRGLVVPCGERGWSCSAVWAVVSLCCGESDTAQDVTDLLGV